VETVKKNKFWLLGVILVSYFVVGFPDGSFTISWLGIADELQGMTTAHTGYILVGYSVTYTLAGVILSKVNRYMRLQTIYFFGLCIMGLGFVALALSNTFASVLATITLYGFGYKLGNILVGYHIAPFKFNFCLLLLQVLNKCAKFIYFAITSFLK